MALIPYRPFRDLEEFFDEWLDHFKEWTLPEFSMIEEPRMDIYEKGDKIFAEVEMPGIDPSSINVSVEDNLLKIEAKKEEKKEKKGKGYYRKELRSGYLRRVVTLPAKVKGEAAKATYENGVLTIEIPKVKEEKSKKTIKVTIKK